jgi:NarL family two-component system response regulator LiaR
MNQPDCIRILITDDYAVVRNGLRSFLSAYEDFTLVGEAASGEQAVRLCAQHLPDVVLMDLVMPGMDGAEATRLIRQKHPGTQVIALTSFKEREQVKAALQAGAIGYLLKDVSAEELAEAIRQARLGRPTLAPQAAEVLIQTALHPQEPVGFDLTAREREVLALMAAGLNNQEIAGKLYISLSTAKSHVSNVLSKMGAATRTEAVSLALKHGLVPSP